MCFCSKGSCGIKILTMIFWVVNELPQISIPDTYLKGQFQMIYDNSGIFRRKGKAPEVTAGEDTALLDEVLRASPWAC